MANADAPRGAWPLWHPSGIIRPNAYTIASTYASNVFTGDFVKLVAGGGIEVAAAGDRLLGVFNGCYYVDAQGDPVLSRHWPSGITASDIIAYVYDDPAIRFGVQSAGSTVAADVGTLGDHVAGTGNTSTGQSAHEINGTTGTGAAGLRVLGKVERPDNAWGTNVDLVVEIYEHELSKVAPATPGV